MDEKGTYSCLSDQETALTDWGQSRGLTELNEERNIIEISISPEVFSSKKVLRGFFDRAEVGSKPIKLI